MLALWLGLARCYGQIKVRVVMDMVRVTLYVTLTIILNPPNYWPRGNRLPSIIIMSWTALSTTNICLSIVYNMSQVA